MTPRFRRESFHPAAKVPLCFMLSLPGGAAPLPRPLELAIIRQRREGTWLDHRAIMGPASPPRRGRVA
jgi:hypothetical protein